MILPFLFIALCIGFGAGVTFACCYYAAGAQDVWEVTTLDGEVWWFDNPNDVRQLADIVGLVAVRRMKASEA